MKNKYIIFGLILSLTCSFAQAQQVMVKEKKIGSNGTPTFLLFDTDSTQYQKGNEKAMWKDYLDITSSDQLKKVKSRKDKQDVEHDVYQQYYKGIKVENASYRVHFQNGKIKMANGRFIKIENLEVSPKLQEEEAIQIALDKTRASKYAWESEGMEKMLKEETGDETATYYPEPELVIWHPYRENETHLAYKIKVYSLEPYNHEYIYIDASNGSILDRDPITIFSSVTGTADTRYSGTQTLKTDSYSSEYRLRDPSRGNGIETYDMNEGTDFGDAVDFTDNDNNWTATEWHNTEMDDAALDAHWALQNVYDYFLNEHGRESYDDANAVIKAYVHFDEDWQNAAWSSNRILLGDGNGVTNGPRTAIDVMGHEFGHGVCQETCDLEYESESGAINEGLSDIWGACIENYCIEQYNLLNKEIWIHGQDYNWITGGARSLINPNDFSQPDTYGGTFWINPDCGTPTLYNDYCGVHTNSGVMNHWFYLLSAGDGNTHTNDNGDCYFVEGIGIEDAAEIVYSLEADYLDNESDFADARTLSIQLARSLNEEIQITNAWYAVGVGEQFADYPISGPSLVCSSGATFTINNLPSGTTVSWDESSIVTEDPLNPGTFTANGSGYGWVEATLTTNCGDTTTLPKKFFDVGPPEAVEEIQFGSYYYDGYCPYSYYTFTASAPNALTTSYSWSMSDQGYITQGQGTNSVVVYLDTPGDDAWIRVHPYNNCGWATTYTGTNFEVLSCGYGMAVYPNPATDELTLSLDEDVELAQDAVYEITDNYNTKLVAEPLKNKEKKINVSGLKKGLYYISVYNNGELTTEKFLKE